MVNPTHGYTDMLIIKYDIQVFSLGMSLILKEVGQHDPITEKAQRHPKGYPPTEFHRNLTYGYGDMAITKCDMPIFSLKMSLILT